MALFNRELNDEIRKISIGLFKICNLFLIIFNFIYFILVPIRGLATKTVDPWSAFFDILLGIGLIGIFILFYRISHTRAGAFFIAVGFAYWWTIPCNWIINEYDKLYLDFMGTFIIMWIILVFLGLMTLLGFYNLIIETIKLSESRKSVIFGPWYSEISSFEDFINKLKLSALLQTKKNLVKRGVLTVFITILIALPGVFAVTESFSPKVLITPKDYDITFNFWAAPNVTAEYSQDWQDQYGIGPRYYTENVLDELNEHKVNLDLTFGRLIPEEIPMLVDWETRCPNITYRIVLSPSELSDIPRLVIETTELMIRCKQNGTLSAWRGFCFDIEGEPFKYSSSFNSFEEATGMWTSVFDYIDIKSEEIGMTIEMESVSDPWTCRDIPFDNDRDEQTRRQFNSYYPLRFTTYAPMIYRCWYEGDQPWGSEMDPTDPWSTSYSPYSQLLMLNNTIPAGTLGYYIGITNTSCYSRDLEQHEEYDWPDMPPNTGLTNLERDILIAKHFRMEEITFFLAWTWIENGYSMGGLFESYGEDILDVINETVNTDPPESFYIYYDYSDAEGTENLRYDWVYDFSRLEGILEVILMWLGSTLVVVYESKVYETLEKLKKYISAHFKKSKPTIKKEEN